MLSQSNISSNDQTFESLLNELSVLRASNKLSEHKAKILNHANSIKTFEELMLILRQAQDYDRTDLFKRFWGLVLTLTQLEIMLYELNLEELQNFLSAFDGKELELRNFYIDNTLSYSFLTTLEISLKVRSLQIGSVVPKDMSKPNEILQGPINYLSEVKQDLTQLNLNGTLIPNDLINVILTYLGGAVIPYYISKINFSNLTEGYVADLEAKNDIDWKLYQNHQLNKQISSEIIEIKERVEYPDRLKKILELISHIKNKGFDNATCINHTIIAADAILYEYNDKFELYKMLKMDSYYDYDNLSLIMGMFEKLREEDKFEIEKCFVPQLDEHRFSNIVERLSLNSIQNYIDNAKYYSLLDRLKILAALFNKNVDLLDYFKKFFDGKPGRIDTGNLKEALMIINIENRAKFYKVILKMISELQHQHYLRINAGCPVVLQLLPKNDRYDLINFIIQELNSLDLISIEGQEAFKLLEPDEVKKIINTWLSSHAVQISDMVIAYLVYPENERLDFYNYNFAALRADQHITQIELAFRRSKQNEFLIQYLFANYKSYIDELTLQGFEVVSYLPVQWRIEYVNQYFDILNFDQIVECYKYLPCYPLQEDKSEQPIKRKEDLIFKKLDLIADESDLITVLELFPEHCRFELLQKYESQKNAENNIYSDEILSLLAPEDVLCYMKIKLNLTKNASEEDYDNMKTVIDSCFVEAGRPTRK